MMAAPPDDAGPGRADREGQPQGPGMESADHVVFTPGYADLLAANRLVYRPTARRMIAYLAVTLIGAAEIALSLAGPAEDRSLPLGFGVALLLVAPAWRAFLSLWVLPRYARRYHGQAAMLREAYTVSWSEAGLHSRTTRSASFVPWDHYIGRREDDAMLLFFQTDALFQFLPKRVLSQAQLAGIRASSHAVPERLWWSFRPARLRDRG